MKTVKLIVTGIAVSFMLSGTLLYSQTETGRPTADKNGTTVADTESGSSKSRLLFFMNPNGRPCQIQDQILIDSKAEIEKRAEIIYLKTTNRNDVRSFYKYGVRGLPAMILESSDGKVLHRFPLGIQGKETILEKVKLADQK